VSLQERLLHALATIEVLKKGASSQQIPLYIESAYLTSDIAQCLSEAMAVTPADTYCCSPPSLSDASAFHQYTSTYTQCFVSNLVQPSPASQVDYDSSTGCSLPPLTSLHDSFHTSDRLNIGSLHEHKIESENSWEYSSLQLSPDVTKTVDTLFEEFEEFRT
jgi:hypothetical protein